MLDTKALADATAVVVREVVDAAVIRATAPLLARIDVLERRETGPDATVTRAMVDEAIARIDLPSSPEGIDPEEVRGWVAEAVAAIPQPKDGASVSLADIEPMIRSAIGEAVAALPKPEDGRSVTLADVEPLITKEVARAVGELPAPKDGASVTIADVEPVIAAAVDAAVAAMPKPENGKSVTLADVEPFLLAEIGKAVAALPPPELGKSVTVADVEPIILSAVERAVAALPVAKDGVGMAGALIDRTGSLVVTMTDGRTCDLGRVEAEPAKPGKDGLGFDDLTFEHDGERGFVLRFVRGDVVKEFPFTVPVVLDRGVYREGQKYAAGDGVTWAGSYWIAQKETVSKPDSGGDFRLAVKRGRDGKEVTPRNDTPKPV